MVLTPQNCLFVPHRNMADTASHDAGTLAGKAAVNTPANLSERKSQ